MCVVRLPNIVILLALLAMVVAAAGTAPAQDSLPGFAGRAGGPFAGPSILITAQFTAPKADRPAELFVTAHIPESHHIYSVDQPPGGPQKTSISVASSRRYKLAGSFKPTTPPDTHVDTEAWVGLEIQEHHGPVTWHVPLDIAEGVELASLSIPGTVDMQLCDAGQCVPTELAFTARLGAGVQTEAATGGAESAPPIPLPVAAGANAVGQTASAAQPEGATFTGRYRAEGGVVTIEGHLKPSIVAPGGKARIVLTATPEHPWHVYALADRDPNEISKPTLIVIDPPAGLTIRRATTGAEVIEDNQEDLGLGVQRYYRGPVTWQVDVDVPADLAAGDYPLGGIIGYQVCQATGCQPPTGLRMQATLQVGDQTGSTAAPLVFTEAEYGDAAAAAAGRPEAPPSAGVADANELQNAADGNEYSLPWMLVYGLLGGLILNLMPCVLPVIGLKVLSFVDQAGTSRRHAFMLNVWYSIGIVSVFLLLAGLAVGMKMGWGEQFANDSFNIALAAVVFAMGLSLLGVWEIPIPGFVGGQRAADLGEQEGPGGALIKGILTTVLATPCTGPFMGVALGWAVKQPPATTFAFFGSMGIGMASPYLLIGAFPGLISWLPKPGAWMVTFKQIMGFVLLGTVVYLLTLLYPPLVIPAVALLAGIGAGCWWIARTPATSSIGPRIMAWLGGIAVVAVVGLFAFGWLAKVMVDRFDQRYGGAQQSFTAQLEQLTSSQRTVLVDFTADWCLTCKTLERLVLASEEVQNAIERYDVAMLTADYTKKPPAIKEMLARLGSNGVPVIAIFPAGAPEQPIVFRGMYTKSALIEAIERAATGQSAQVERPAG